MLGLAWLNLASGALRLTEAAPNELASLLERIRPAETLVADGDAEHALTLPTSAGAVTRVPSWHFDTLSGRERLCKQLEVASLDGFSAQTLSAACGAAGALLLYAAATQGQQLRHIRSLKVEHESGIHRARSRDAPQSRTDRDAARHRLADPRLAARHLPHDDGQPAVALLAPSRAARPRHSAGAAPGDRHPARRRSRYPCANPSARSRTSNGSPGRLALLSARPRDLASLRDTLCTLPRLARATRAVRRASAADRESRRGARAAAPTSRTCSCARLRRSRQSWSATAA